MHLYEETLLESLISMPSADQLILSENGGSIDIWNVAAAPQQDPIWSFPTNKATPLRSLAGFQGTTSIDITLVDNRIFAHAADDGHAIQYRTVEITPTTSTRNTSTIGTHPMKQ